MDIRVLRPSDIPHVQLANITNLPENYFCKYYLYHAMSWPQLSYVAVDVSTPFLVIRVRPFVSQFQLFFCKRWNFGSILEGRRYSEIWAYLWFRVSFRADTLFEISRLPSYSIFGISKTSILHYAPICSGMPRLLSSHRLYRAANISFSCVMSQLPFICSFSVLSLKFILNPP
jgi:hypothetical protein